MVGRPVGEAKTEFKFKAESEEEFLEWVYTLEKYKSRLARRLVKQENNEIEVVPCDECNGKGYDDTMHLCTRCDGKMFMPE